MKLLLLASLLAAAGGAAMTREQALAHAFGKDAKPISTRWWWSEEQREQLADLAGVDTRDVAAKHVAWHTAKSGADATTAWFDARKVRTKKQILMVVVAADGTVDEVVVTAFGEPHEYLASQRWLEQFEGHALDEDLALKKDIHGITGATLTAQSTVAAVREALAAHAVAYPPPAEDDDEGPPTVEPPETTVAASRP